MTAADTDLFGVTMTEAIAQAREDHLVEQLRRLPHDMTTAASRIRNDRNAAIRRRQIAECADFVRLRLDELLGPRTTAARPCATARPGGRDEQRPHTTSATKPAPPSTRAPGQDHLASPTPAQPTT